MRASLAERIGNYTLLIVFGLFALGPIVTILVAALGPDDAGSGSSGFGNFGKAGRSGTSAPICG